MRFKDPDMPLHAGQSREHAVVIGASLAGLFAARVLSDHFGRVTLIERDPVHNRPESRKGQPQTRHLHGLLAQGKNIIERFFPGIERDLVEGGAIVADMGAATRWFHFGDYRVQFESGLMGMLMSRPFLEWHVRRRVLERPNVSLMAPCVVEELAADAGGTRVDGVMVSNGRDPPGAHAVTADLTLDACGRGSLSPRWLAGLGYDRPSEEEVKIRVGYATRLYRRRPDDLPGAVVAMVMSTPPKGKRLAALFPIEGERWIVTAGGWAGDHPPTDEEGYLRFMREMPAPDIYDVICRAEPLSDIVAYKFPANLRRNYQDLRRFPDGYLVLGDAVASFNPIYGQGMTSAAMQAEALDELLRGQRPLGGFWRPYFKRIGRIVDLPWQMAVGEDFRFPETEGAKPFGVDLINAYVARVHRATHHDPVVYAQFLRAMNLLAPASSLMRPRIAWRVLRGRAIR
jgi:2-polyprenyl-6-methoxyphenol hydroxylase-like FAD-dependent oxidoreductase